MSYIPQILLAVFIVLIGIVGWRTLLAPNVAAPDPSLTQAINAELVMVNFVESILSLPSNQAAAAAITSHLTTVVSSQFEVTTVKNDLLIFMGLDTLPVEPVSIDDIYFTSDQSVLIEIGWSEGVTKMSRSVELIVEDSDWKVNAVYAVG